MRLQMIVGVLVAAACLAASQPPGTKTDQDALQGVWNVVGFEQGGKAIPPEMFKEVMDGSTLTVKGTAVEFKMFQVTVKDVGGKPEMTKKEKVETGTVKIDPSKKPKQIDIAKREGGTMTGIYELTGDDLKVCLDPEGKERPTEFKTKESSMIGTMVLKRLKK